MKIRRLMASALALLVLLAMLPTAALAAVGTGWNDDCRGNSRPSSTPGSIEYGKHNWVKQWEDPTGCTTPMYVGYTCSYCGASVTREAPAPGHSWGSWQTTRQATCTQNGEQNRTCSVCGQKETRSTDKAAHAWGSWQTTRQATCTQNGEQNRTCSVCGQKETRSTDKGAHSWDSWQTTRQATCTETGSRERKCKVCGEKQTETVAKVPHTWSAWEEIVPATDHSSGTRAHTCQVCGAQETEDYDPEGTLRRGDKGNAVVALQEGLICYGVLTGKADGSFGPGTEKAVVAAQEAEGLAADGVAWPQTQARLGHRFGEWEVVSEISDFSAGIRQRTCSRCGYTETEEEWPSPIYRRGDKGDDVKGLQEALNAAGYDCGKADGDFGGKTESAVKAFEGANGIEADGIAWPGVLKMLGVISGSPATRQLDPNATGKGGEAALLVVIPRSYKQNHEYAVDDELVFDAYIQNETDVDLDAGRIEMRVGGHVLDGGMLGQIKAGDISEGIECRYALTQEDIDGGAVTFLFSGVCDYDSESMATNDVTLTYEFADERSGIEFIVADIPAQPYKAGDIINVHAVLHNQNETDSLTLESIETSGEYAAISDEAWMHADIAPGSYNDFNLAITVTDWDIERGWGYVRLFADGTNVETGESVFGYKMVLFAIQVEGPSVALLLEDTTGMGGRLGGVFPVQLTAVNNGTVDLKVWDFDSEAAGGVLMTADYNDFPEEYKTLFPAGASRTFTNYVCVSPSDVDLAHKSEFGCFDRFFELYANDPATGELYTDQQAIYLVLFEDGMEGDEPVYPLSLNVTSDTAETDFQVGDTVFFNIALYNNTDETVLAPWIQAYDGVGAPREEYVADNIPASQGIFFSDQYTFTEADAALGTVTLLWRAGGSGASGASAYTEPVELTFNVTSAYGWTPPVVPTALPLQLAKEEVSTPQHADGYWLGETISYRITATNPNDTALENVEIYDCYGFSGGEELLYSGAMEAHETKEFSFDYTLTLKEVAARWASNSAYANVAGLYNAYASPVTSTVSAGGGGPKLTLGVSEVSPIAASYAPDGYGFITTITYDYTVTNAGDTPLELAGVGYYLYPDTEAIEHLLPGSEATLQPGESFSGTADVTFTADNIASWAPDRLDIEFLAFGRVPDTDVYINSEPSVSFSYHIGEGADVAAELALSGETEEYKPAYYPGDTFSTLLSATNAGDAALYGLTITLFKWDWDAASWQEIGAIYQDDPEQAFAPGGSVTLTDVYNIVEADAGMLVTLQYVAEGKTEDGTTVASDPYDFEFNVGVRESASAIRLEKVQWNMPANEAGYALGETIEYGIYVGNMTDSAIAEVEVYDPLAGTNEDMMITLIPTLEPNAQVLVLFGYVVTEEDVARGYVENTAFAAWMEEGAEEYRRVDSNTLVLNTIGGDPDGGFIVVKRITSTPADPEGYQPGETIDFEIDVTNNSGETVDYVPVYDYLNGSTEGVPADTFHAMVPGETRTATYAYTVQESDVASGQVINQAAVLFEGDQGEEDVYFWSNSVQAAVVSVPTNGRIQAYKSIEQAPANDAFFVPGEDILFQIYVENETGGDITDVEVYDPLMNSASKLVGTISLIPAGGGESVSFPYTVTEMDALNGSVTNIATVNFTFSNGVRGTWVTNEVTAPTGFEFEPMDALLGLEVFKTEVSTPTNGSFYVEGETIAYDITVVNTGDIVIDEVIVFDTLAAGSGEIASIENFAPTDSRSYAFTHVVNSADVIDGKVINRASATFTLGDGSGDTVISDPVISPTGVEPKEDPLIPPVTLNPTEPDQPSKDPDQPPMTEEPSETPTPAATPVPGTDAADYCKRVLTGKGDGTTAFELIYCEEHAVTADTVSRLIEQAETPDEQLAQWKYSIDLWTEALNAEYDELLAEASDAEKPIILEERVLFYLQLTAKKEALEQRFPDDPTTVAMKVSEQLMNKCADLCYETHTAPDARIDSRVSGNYTAIEALFAGEDCVRIVTATETGAVYQEDLCEQHRVAESAVDALLSQVDTSDALPEMWRSAEQLWLVELDAITNERYLAADEGTRPLIAAERVSFGNWLRARETFLTLMYPGRPEIVNEVMAQTIRARALDLCIEDQ